MTNCLAITEKTKVKQKRERASYDYLRINSIIDEAVFGTISFTYQNNVYAIPTAIWRENDHLYIHGSNGSRLTKALLAGATVCVSITNIKGLVLARSATHHSINYDSVCIYGVFEKVSEDQKSQRMQAFMEQKMPERWQFVRPPNKKELAAVTILYIPIIEAVSKSRQGPPTDPEADLAFPVWAGVVPIETKFGIPQQTEEQKHLALPGLPDFKKF